VQNKKAKTTHAKVGLILSIIGLVLFAVIFIVGLLFIRTMFSAAIPPTIP
jgi:hypothetical protein